jgi:hypothetical protein
VDRSVSLENATHDARRQPHLLSLISIVGCRPLRLARAAETRLRIIEAAGKLFVERGYAATTIDAVAAEADVAVETVYPRFKNERNLLEARSACSTSRSRWSQWMTS